MTRDGTTVQQQLRRHVMDADWLLENVPSNARNEGVETEKESDEPTPPPPRKASRLDEWGFEAVHEGTPPGKPCL